jgi:hypothetical protein
MTILTPEVFNDELWRNLVLLAAGALVTGILVPIVKTIMDSLAARSQKQLEAQLARQKELIDAQVKLLADFADHVWALIFELSQVSYAYAWEDEARQKEAFAAYGLVSWKKLTEIRSDISKAARLVSAPARTELLALYDWLLEVDDRVCIMVDARRPKPEWQAYHQEYFPVAGQRVDKAVAELATEFRLTAGRF